MYVESDGEEEEEVNLKDEDEEKRSKEEEDAMEDLMVNKVVYMNVESLGVAVAYILFVSAIPTSHHPIPSRATSLRVN